MVVRLLLGVPTVGAAEFASMEVEGVYTVLSLDPAGDIGSLPKSAMRVGFVGGDANDRWALFQTLRLIAEVSGQIQAPDVVYSHVIVQDGTDLPEDGLLVLADQNIANLEDHSAFGDWGSAVGQREFLVVEVEFRIDCPMIVVLVVEEDLHIAFLACGWGEADVGAVVGDALCAKDIAELATSPAFHFSIQHLFKTPSPSFWWDTVGDRRVDQLVRGELDDSLATFGVDEGMLNDRIDALIVFSVGLFGGSGCLRLVNGIIKGGLRGDFLVLELFKFQP